LLPLVQPPWRVRRTPEAVQLALQANELRPRQARGVAALLEPVGTDQAQVQVFGVDENGLENGVVVGHDALRSAATCWRGYHAAGPGSPGSSAKQFRGKRSLAGLPAPGV